MTQARDLADGKFDTNTLVVDASNNRLGVGTASPSQEMHLYAGSGATDLLIEQGSTGNSYLHTKNSNREYAIGTASDQLKFIDLTADAVRMSILSGGGLTFNGDTAAANALDDYEEGSFTPTVGGSTTDPSTAVEGVGRYTKIGRVVTFNILFANKTISGAAGNIEIRSMPFAPDNNINAVFPIASHNANSDGTFTVATLTGGSTTCELLHMADQQGWTNSAIYNSGGFYLYITGSYNT